MGTNIRRKELKGPDHFVSFWTRVSHKVAEMMVSRKRAIAVGLGVLVLVVAGSLAFASMRERRAVAASQMLARVQKITTAELLTADRPPESPAPADDGIPRFKTDAERRQAAVKEIDTFLASKPSNPLREESLLTKAAFLIDLGRHDEAIALYGQLLSGDLAKHLRFLAHEGIGYAYEAKGELDKAATAFSRLGEEAAASGGFYQDRATYHKGRIAERKGDKPAAIKLYHEVLDKMPDSTLRDEISSRLAILEPK